MKISDIIKSVGAGLVREVVPGGGLLLAAVNEMLPDDKQLPITATGSDLSAAVATLPPIERAVLLGREFDVRITEIKEGNSTLRTMLEADKSNPHSTRPAIAWWSFVVVAFISVVVVLVWAGGVLSKDAEVVKATMAGWPFVLTIIAPFMILLRSYFGVLKAEHSDRLNAAGGLPLAPSVLTRLMGKQ